MVKVLGKSLRVGVCALVAGAMLVSAADSASAAFMPVAPAQGAALAIAAGVAPVNVRYRRYVYARRHGGGDAALALGILGLGVAAAIAVGSQHQRRSYYEPSYEPQYRPTYEPQYEPDYYQQPVYAPPPVVYEPQAPEYEEQWHHRRYHVQEHNPHGNRDDMYQGQRRHRERYAAPE